MLNKYDEYELIGIYTNVFAFLVCYCVAMFTHIYLLILVTHFSYPQPRGPWLKES